MRNLSIKSIIPYLIAIVLFVIISLAYLNPLLEGKRLRQDDVTRFKGMSKEIADYREKTGEEPLWSNSMFGGMPAYQISIVYKANLTTYIDKIFQFVNSNNFVNMNMKEFNKWCEERYNLEPEFQYTNSKLSSKFDSEHVFIKTSTNDGFMISQQKDMQIDKVTLRSHLKPFKKHDLKRIRKFHWRDLLYDHESRKSKNAFK